MTRVVHTDEPAVIYSYRAMIRLSDDITLGKVRTIEEKLTEQGVIERQDAPGAIVALFDVQAESEFAAGFRLAALIDEVQSGIDSYGFGTRIVWTPLDGAPEVPEP